MPAYLFEVMYDADGPCVKYGVDVSDLVSDEYNEAIVLARAAKKAAVRLGVSGTPGMMRSAIMPIIQRDALEEKLAKLRPMFVRAQFTGGELHLLKTEEPMTFEEIDDLMRHMLIKGELRAFLEKAKV